MANLNTQVTSGKDSFSKSLALFVDGVKGKENLFLQEYTQDLLQEMVISTPVDTGFARASWYAAVNDPGMDHVVKAPVGGAPGSVPWQKFLAESVITLKKGKIGDTIFLMNNAAYIMALEYGHSQQAPDGMVRMVLAKYQQIADTVIARINKR